MPVERINAWFDALPRSTFSRLFMPAPAFRSLGVAGFYVAAVATFVTGLVDGRSPLVLAGLSATCALSFFAWALVRKLVTGRENLVLLEHVWFALACSVVFLEAMQEPLAGYLDAVAAGLCCFLAFGRAGCTVVGCCHGPPSSLGITYPRSLVEDGFSAPLAGVRLFPTQLLELAGLVALGAVVALLTCLARDGAGVLVFLSGYAIMRFGLEGLRFDPRPHLLGLSQSRWMALVELAVVAAAWEYGRPQTPRLVVLWAALAVLLVIALVVRARLDPARTVTPAHARAVRSLVRELAADATATPRVATAGGHSVGVSRSPAGLHVSLSCASLWLACRLAVLVFPELAVVRARATEHGLLLLELSAPPEETAPGAGPAALSLYGHVVRELQASGALDDRAPATSSELNVVRSKYFGHQKS
ncbi:MAG: hypothetical protein AMXMBFR34_29210 [Myxococcaceae bacterium]